MTDAPERIWAGPRGATYSTEAEQRTTEYVRRQRVEALEAENARLRDHATRLHDVLAVVTNGDVERAQWIVRARFVLAKSRAVLGETSND